MHGRTCPDCDITYFSSWSLQPEASLLNSIFYDVCQKMLVRKPPDESIKTECRVILVRKLDVFNCCQCEQITQCTKDKKEIDDYTHPRSSSDSSSSSSKAQNTSQQDHLDMPTTKDSSDIPCGHVPCWNCQGMYFEYFETTEVDWKHEWEQAARQNDTYSFSKAFRGYKGYGRRPAA